MTTLPIYRVRSESVKTDRAVEIAERAYRLRRFELSRTPPTASGQDGPPEGSVTVRDGRCQIEIDGTATWAANHGLMWRPELKPRLPVPDEATAIAARFIRTHRLFPTLPPGFRCALTRYGGTRTAAKRDGARMDRPLDIKLHYGVNVLLPEPVPEVGAGGEAAQQIPLVGGGGKLSVTVGDRGDVWGHSLSWRPIDGRACMAEMISRHHTDEEFRALTQQLRVVEYDARLAYYAAPAFAAQEYLYPVYVYSGVADVGGHRVPLRQILVPATEFGPYPPEPAPQARRAAESPATPLRASADRVRHGYGADTAPFRAGTSWIGLSGGLTGSQTNARGFVEGLAEDGWKVAFNWGDGNAWASDWRSDPDRGVEAADAVFYAGHANMNGWVLADPDGGGLDFAELRGSSRRPWRANDVEWAIVAGCGPLQDEVIRKGGGDVFTRWDGAFDGLHTLLGYAGTTFDNAQEGARVVRYGRSGMNLIDAWFRTSQEVQPSDNGAAAPDGPDVWVGAMYVVGAGNDPRDDHFWGHGSVSADPLNPGTYVALWTTC